MIFDNELFHYGTPRHSGRYPYGSGDNPYQHASGFLARIDELRAEGKTEAQIANEMGMSTTQLRARKSIANSERIAAEQAQALRLKDKGYNNTEIARIMGTTESTIRNRLNPALQERASRIQNTADILKDQVESKTYLDIGKGVEHQLGISETQLKTAVAMLEEQGYKKHYLKVEQATNPGNYTYVKVLTKDDVSYSDVYNNREKVTSPLGVYTEDGGRTWSNIQPPLNISSDRIAICYAEQGGTHKDGVIELRPGVKDLSLGQSSYAQVRIAVDGTHYLKGMAMYNDNLPPGIDIRFNTNKHEGTPMIGPKDNSVLKSIKSDPDNPFGSTVRQLVDGNGKVYSACNIVNDDSDWGKWSKNLASQMLSKQDPQLAKRQLDLAYREKKQEFDTICAYSNPAIKKRLLDSFASECDSDAVHLKAAALPRQQTHVILPLTTLKDNEVYAPNYKTGEEVVLIRYPHGGIFEIPRLTVNNNNQEGKKLLGNPKNAIGINSHVAERLSGADFDGDTVVVIPTKGQNIKTSAPLRGLQNFDPKEMYRAYPGMPEVSPKTGFHKQRQMGDVSNLITDMTIKGAPSEEIARAVRHSMVVIDAEKHNLNWRQSYDDNGIAALKEKYQGGKNKGAATLISQASGRKDVPMRKDYIPERDIDPATGKINWRTTGEQYTNKKGKLVYRTEQSTKMYEVSDAHTLSSGTRMERIYADHANRMKALANDARKEYIATPNIKVNASAKKTYANEVKSLDAKLNIALKNAPRERQAQLIANHIIAKKKKDNPDMSKDEIKKLKDQTLREARARTGTIDRKKRNIEITDREWEAIQAGAVSNTKLQQILRNTDEDKLKERAMPRNNRKVTQSAISRAKAMMNAGYTQAEAAEAAGISVSTLQKEL